MNTEVEQLLADVTRMLALQGKMVTVTEATPERIQLSLQGFCGGCGCSQSYIEGLTEMLTEKYPQTRVECVVVS